MVDVDACSRFAAAADRQGMPCMEPGEGGSIGSTSTDPRRSFRPFDGKSEIRPLVEQSDQFALRERRRLIIADRARVPLPRFRDRGTPVDSPIRNPTFRDDRVERRSLRVPPGTSRSSSMRDPPVDPNVVARIPLRLGADLGVHQDARRTGLLRTVSLSPRAPARCTCRTPDVAVQTDARRSISTSNGDDRQRGARFQRLATPLPARRRCCDEERLLGRAIVDGRPHRPLRADGTSSATIPMPVRQSIHRGVQQRGTRHPLRYVGSPRRSGGGWPDRNRSAGSVFACQLSVCGRKEPFRGSARSVNRIQGIHVRPSGSVRTSFTHLPRHRPVEQDPVNVFGERANDRYPLSPKGPSL